MRWYLASVTTLGLVGVCLLRYFFGKYQYTAAKLLVYATFVFLKIYYLMLTSKLQMRSSMERTLQAMSLIKACGFGVVLMGVSALREHPNLLAYAFLSVLYSSSMAYGMTWSLNKRAAPAVPIPPA